MNPIILFYIITGIALLCLWIALSQWSRKQAHGKEIQRLRAKGIALATQVAEMTVEEALAKVHCLISEKAIAVTRRNESEALPPLLSDLPVSQRGLFENYKHIVIPEASIDLGWQYLRTVNGKMLYIGHDEETDQDIVIESTSGRVIIGRDSFPSLAHYLVFEAE